MAPNDLTDLRDRLREFAAEREWQPFHSPKNLALALSVEAGELLEQFQWMGDEDSRRLSVSKHAAVREEVADVFLYLIRLADQLGIDLAAAGRDKIAINASKYPVAKSRGTSRKYTEL
jgi:NTP pyrophosphatase (non-canonical NTP hydrolase)